MPLRIATLETARRTPEDWQHLVGDAVAAGTRAALSRDPDRLRATFAEIAEWDEPLRVEQARYRLTEAVFAAADQLPDDAWGAVYTTAADALLDALAAEPHRPVLLNYAGVLLYELTELGGAEALFKAAKKLDPSLPFVDRNLTAVRARKRAHNRVALRGPLAVKARALGVRARPIAAAARPLPARTISLCMIVKDEEEMLPGCLEPLRGAVDELVVVDTGSTDRTVEIAESFGATVVHFAWNGSFADARNAGIERATGDWILYLDADEHLVAEDAPELRRLASRVWRDVFHLPMTNFTGGGEGAPGVAHLAPRLFRNRPGRRFVGRVHERIGDMPYFLPERFETAPVRILHYGYLKNRVLERDKSRRNLELLEREAADAPGPFTDYNLGVEYVRLGQVAEATERFEASWQALGDGFVHTGYGPALAARLGACLRELGRRERARTVLEAALAALPDHTDYVLQLALLAQEEGDRDEAERLARRCLELGDAPPAYIATVGAGTYFPLSLLADLALARGDADRAERLWRRSLDEHPEYLMPILRLVPALAARGEDVETIETQLPEGPTARLLTATALLESARAGDAETLFRSVLESDPANPPARVGLVEALLSQRRYADAAAEAGSEPDDSVVAPLAAAAEMFARAADGDADGLARACGRAAAVRPDEDVAFYRAWLALLAGETPEAQPPAAAAAGATALEALLRVEDVDTFVVALRAFEQIDLPERERQELLARIYFRRGFLDSAADEWIAAAKSAPDARAYVGLAQVARARGLAEDALVLADAALAVEPAHVEALRLRDALAAAA